MPRLSAQGRAAGCEGRTLGRHTAPLMRVMRTRGAGLGGEGLCGAQKQPVWWVCSVLGSCACDGQCSSGNVTSPVAQPIQCLVVAVH